MARAAEQVAAGDLTVRLHPSGNDELAQLVATFNAMTANLDRSMNELRRMEAHSRRFASDVSHELRSPLAAMTAVTEVLSDSAGDMSGPAGRASRLVVQEIANLDRLVNDLIEMSRFDAGTAVLDVDVVDVASAVQACLALRGWTSAVDSMIPAGLAVAVDRRRFDVIVANLVGNAVRHGTPPVAITAGFDAGSGWLVLIGHRPRAGHRSRGPAAHLRTVLQGGDRADPLGWQRPRAGHRAAECALARW